jgi:hypothetical protein
MDLGLGMRGRAVGSEDPRPQSAGRADRDGRRSGQGRKEGPSARGRSAGDNSGEGSRERRPKETGEKARRPEPKFRPSQSRSSERTRSSSDDRQKHDRTKTEYQKAPEKASAESDQRGERPLVPPVPDEIQARDLDRAARGRLKTLSAHDAEWVARHLVMAGRLLDTDPELAYQHARGAVLRAGRVDVVREAAGLAAYHTGRYAEALRELRTVRRLNGSCEHLPVMADCERGLGRPERALELARDPGVKTLDEVGTVELALVVAGARLDLNEPTGALVALDTPTVKAATGDQSLRVAEVRADALEAAGRDAEAQALRATLGGDEVIVMDLEEDAADKTLTDAAQPEATDPTTGEDGR